MIDNNSWEKDIESVEGKLDELKHYDKNKPKTYFLIKFFIVVSCVLGLFLKPITLCWTIPMAIYVIYKIEANKKIGKTCRLLAWLLISPVVGGLLIKYKVQ